MLLNSTGIAQADVASRLQCGRPTNLNSIRSNVKKFIFSPEASRSIRGPKRILISWVHEAICQGIERPGSKAVH